VKTQGKREFETIQLFAGCCVVPLATTHGPHGLVIVSRLVTNFCWYDERDRKRKPVNSKLD
jgi:hypothetical protein